MPKGGNFFAKVEEGATGQVSGHAAEAVPVPVSYNWK
ncbi:hypothetical protein HNR53_003420 [Bacillus benzoevorans]|uniref:Uncharacterized protein n=1 Tax=Bacillus benzoevorans TaxID=1456 RepID=A0A7X0LW63_9BACI|nr:hypothetical protein [Bacillus benzoevorans]